jgi:hypothetical protein
LQMGFHNQMISRTPELFWGTCLSGQISLNGISYFLCIDVISYRKSHLRPKDMVHVRKECRSFTTHFTWIGKNSNSSGFPRDLGEGLSDRQSIGEEESEVGMIEPRILSGQMPEADQGAWCFLNSLHHSNIFHENSLWDRADGAKGIRTRPTE